MVIEPFYFKRRHESFQNSFYFCHIIDQILNIFIVHGNAILSNIKSLDYQNTEYAE